MRKLGISIYPMHTSIKENLEYIDLGIKYGFKRIFTCLLSVEGDRKNILEEFKATVEYANQYGMEVIVDTNPEVLDKLGIGYDDLSMLKDMGFYGIRLDGGFSGNEESIMTFNKENLKIELNMSSGTKYLDNIMSFKPNTENILGCHNFYPHRYTGLGYEHFMECNKMFKKYNIRTAAFVSSKNAKIGPWPLSEGLSTLEDHRDMDIVVQAKHLLATELIDDIIIANAFASEKELSELSKIDLSRLSFRVKLEEGISDIERKIVLEEEHFNRGDISEYLIRSSMSRIKYKGYELKPYNTRDIKKGDILIDNSLYNNYAGELQIALRDMKNSGKTNVVGRVLEEEVFLIDFIKPWQKFLITE